jgi:hypothetical protein
MTRTFVTGLFVLLSIAVPARSSPLMVATCSAPTGLNIASDIERDRPESSVPQTYDSEAQAYVSHPRNTQRSIITVNTNGIASLTYFRNDGTSMVIDMQIVGTADRNTITLIGGKNGLVGATSDIVTLYPKDGIAISAGTSYFGWNKAIPTGYAYISHCKFSNVIN